MSGCGSDPERAIERLGTLADVSQPSAVGSLYRVKPPTVVFDPHGEDPVAVVQAELDSGGGTRVFYDVLDRFGAAEVHRGLGFMGAAGRGSCDVHADRYARRLRAECFGEAKLGERKRVDPVGDFSQRCERGRGVVFEGDEGGGERGRCGAILFGEL